MRLGFYVVALLYGLAIGAEAARPGYGIEDAVAVAKKQNLEIAIARKQIQAGSGGLVLW